MKDRKIKSKKRLARFIAINLLLVVLGAIFLSTPLLKPLEHSLLSYYMKQNMSHTPHEDLIVVGIDQASLEEIGRYPWDRSVYVSLLDKLNQPGNEAKVIAFDITFSNESNPESDRLLAEALRQYDHIIFPVIANLENEFTRTTKVKKDELIRANSLEKPYDPFAESVHLAHINAVLDTDGIIRRTWLQLDSPEGRFYSLAYKAASLAGADVESYLTRHPQAELVIDYQAASYDFLTVSFADVLNGNFPAANFKDAIVLVGYTAVGFEMDNGTTPVEKEMKMVYAHANIIHQLLNGGYVTVVPDRAGGMLAIVLMGLAVYYTWRFRTLTSVLLTIGTALMLLIFQFVCYTSWTIHMDSVHPLTAMAIAFAANIAMKSIHESRQKQFITEQFGRYISPDLVKAIAESEQEIQLGGVKKEVSVVFLDIRGYTPLTEKMAPEEVVDFLNMMFDLITEKTLENKGTIDKFIGDAAMLIFNAPIDVPDHAFCAVKTGFDIQQGMKQVRREIYDKYGVEVNVGIGINTGEAVVGNIGSYLRVDYTAIGDHVNVAARIESVSEAGQILVSASTYERTKASFVYTNAGQFSLKGKSEEIILYELKDVR